jgi:RNA polymerase-binding transcription factor DksA
MAKIKSSVCDRCDTPTDSSLLVMIRGVKTCSDCSESIDVDDGLNSEEFSPNETMLADMINFGDYL